MKQIQTRIINKHATEAEWNDSTLIIRKGELIVYDPDDSNTIPRIKIGDGIHTAAELPFVDDALHAELLTKESIIDVLELPETAIDTNATYRLLEGSFFMKGMQRGDSTCHIVEWDTIPEEAGESVLTYTDYGFGFVGYYNKKDNTVYGYFSDETIQELKDYVNDSDLNALVKMIVSAALNVLTKGWKTMEEVVNTIGSALSISWGGVVTSTEDMTEEDALYLYLSSEYYNYANGAWIGTTSSGVGQVGQGMGGEIFNHPANVALGTASHAEGQFTEALGNASHAEGFETLAEGSISHAEGDKSQATGMVAHAEGYNTIASGAYAHSEGFETQSTGIASHASGMGTIATGEGQAVVGSYNVQDANAKFIVGNGTKAGPNGAESRKNAFVVKNDGSADIHGTTSVYGGLNVAGKTTFSQDVKFNTGAEFDKEVFLNAGATVRTVLGNVVMSSSKVATENTVANAFRQNYIQTGAKSGQPIGTGATIEGKDNIASGACSHAEGNGSKALGDITHAEGANTEASGAYSHSEGVETQSVGVAAHVEGYLTTAEGAYSHSEGQGTTTTAEATWAHVEGVNTIASALATHAEGNSTIAASYAQHVQGQFNAIDESTTYAHIVGNGPDEENRSNAHTLDWNGNAWYQGNVFVGGADQESGEKLATENYVSTNVYTKTESDDRYVHRDEDSNSITQTNAAPYMKLLDGTLVDGFVINNSEVKAYIDNQTVVDNKTITSLLVDENGYKYVCYDTNEDYIGTLVGTTTFTVPNPESHTQTIGTEAAINVEAIVYEVDGYSPKEGDCINVNERCVTYLGGKWIYRCDDIKYCTYNQATGENSVALSGMGYAVGKQALALGRRSIALGRSSVAEGNDTFAAGLYAHTEGSNTAALGNTSHAEGTLTVAKGGNSHAEGNRTIAKSDSSHAEGIKTEANGNAAHAEGDRTVAQGAASHAEGAQTKATGDHSHTEGFATEAVGEASHSEGYVTTANGKGSHTEGGYTNATAIYAHAEGHNTSAAGEASHAEGKSTHGSTAEHTSSTDVINEWNDNKFLMAYGDYSHAEGEDTLATGRASHTEGQSTQATGQNSHAEGQRTRAGGEHSHAEGLDTEATKTAAHSEGIDTHATEIYAHAEGEGSTASKEASHAEGVRTLADHTGAHAEGYGSKSIGHASHAEGQSTEAIGHQSHAEGQNTKAQGYQSHAEGKDTLAYGAQSHAGGLGTVADGVAQTVVGKYNKKDNESLFIVGSGSGSSNSERKNIFRVTEDTIYGTKKDGTELDILEAIENATGDLGGTIVKVNGEAVSEFDADTKLDKVTSTASKQRLYCINTDGTQTEKAIGTSGYDIPVRAADGNIPLPLNVYYQPQHAVPKKYVDSLGIPSFSNVFWEGSSSKESVGIENTYINIPLRITYTLANMSVNDWRGTITTNSLSMGSDTGSDLSTPLFTVGSEVYRIVCDFWFTANYDGNYETSYSQVNFNCQKLNGLTWEDTADIVVTKIEY